MSIASEITRIKGNIENCYTEVSNKGGTLPQIQNSNNLATAIASIGGGGGMEYETGTYTTTVAEQTPQIYFSNYHEDLPAYICFVKADDTAPELNGLAMWNYIDYEKLVQYPEHYNTNTGLINVYSQCVYAFQRIATSATTSVMNMTHSSEDTTDTSKAYPRYWVNDSWFKLHLDELSTSYTDITLDAYTDYNWIAIWV